VSVSATYAEALYQAAADKGVVAAVAADLAGLGEALAPGTELARVLHSPQVDSRGKKAALAGLSDTANPLTVNLLQVLVDRGRLEELPAISSAFAERVSAAEGRIAVEVTSAIPLPDDLRDKVVARIREQSGKTPEITEHVDPDIIGGLVIRVGGVVTDASVRGRLHGLRRTISGARA
jgi:F-type H+-transporting ATPase subunit delta